MDRPAHETHEVVHDKFSCRHWAVQLKTPDGRLLTVLSHTTEVIATQAANAVRAAFRVAEVTHFQVVVDQHEPQTDITSTTYQHTGPCWAGKKRASA